MGALQIPYIAGNHYGNGGQTNGCYNSKAFHNTKLLKLDDKNEPTKTN